MPKPTETRLSVPTAKVANNRVSISPIPSVSRIGTINRQLRTARNSQSEIRTMLAARPATMPCATVANSSSASATEPVTRTRASPEATSGNPAISSRRRAAAAPPGCKAPKSSLGWTRTKRLDPARSPSWPPRSLVQDKACGLPASESAIVLWKAVKAGRNGSRSAWPLVTPWPNSDRAENRPRALGSAASSPRKGWRR